MRTSFVDSERWDLPIQVILPASVGNEAIAVDQVHKVVQQVPGVVIELRFQQAREDK